MTSVSETMREKWKDPKFRAKTEAAMKKSLDERIKQRLLRQLERAANGGD